MQATNQNKLLRVLGVNPKWWTLYPSILAASIASPILTAIGTSFALVLGGYVASYYGINTTTYWKDLQNSIFPVLRLQSFEHCWDGVEEESSSTNILTIISSMMYVVKDAIFDYSSNDSTLDLRVTYKTSTSSTYYWWWIDTLIEVSTYPIFYHLLKAEVFILIIIGVAEWVARSKSNLTPRGVPSVITMSVVIAGLCVIFADWAFSQLWLLRE
jgi:ABC-type transporter Mla maintaining outer membrane lipid asymmetry permease subunit MlaE